VRNAEALFMLLGQPHAPAAIPLRKIPTGPQDWSGCFRGDKNLILVRNKTTFSLHSIHYSEDAVPAHGYGNSPCQKQNFLFFG